MNSAAEHFLFRSETHYVLRKNVTLVLFITTHKKEARKTSNPIVAHDVNSFVLIHYITKKAYFIVYFGNEMKYLQLHPSHFALLSVFTFYLTARKRYVKYYSSHAHFRPQNSLCICILTQQADAWHNKYIPIYEKVKKMRTIAVIKKCTDIEKELILSAARDDDRVLFFDDENALLKSGDINETEIIFGEPEYITILSMKKLRWIQMTWAGANKYTALPDFPKDVILTSASGAFGCVISEYIISGMLALTKKLYAYREQIQNGGWEKLSGDDTLEGKHALILGCGNIGQETAKKLKCFGAYTVGICRTEKDSLPYFDEIYTSDHIDEQIKRADAVIIALPGTRETAGMIDKKRLSSMKKNAILVNVGRGAVVDTDALTHALRSGSIGGAVLDVTEPEPLPEDHPLRNMDNVILTPHISGISWGENTFTRKRIIDIFCENLAKDISGEPKRNIIDLSKGY